MLMSNSTRIAGWTLQQRDCIPLYSTPLQKKCK